MTDTDFFNNYPSSRLLPITYPKMEELVQGQNYCVAGGYPRDLYFGAVPKDIDCWVEWVAPANGIGRGNMDTVIERLEDSGIPFEEFSMYGSADDRQRLAVLRCPGLDIIFMETLHGLTDGFDFNLNQFYMEPGLGPVYVGSSNLNLGIKQLKYDDRVEDRKSRMEEKWWAYVGKRPYNEEIVNSFYVGKV